MPIFSSICGSVAQLREHCPCKAKVVGLSPTGSTREGWQNGLKGSWRIEKVLVVPRGEVPKQPNVGCVADKVKEAAHPTTISEGWQNGIASVLKTVVLVMSQLRVRILHLPPMGASVNGKPMVSKTITEGSIPSAPAKTLCQNVAQSSRALGLGPRGRGSEAHRSDKGFWRERLMLLAVFDFSILSSNEFFCFR